ncbi:hypothetical protein LE197_05695 [Pseudomonas sp. PS1(2021)]|uniref:hypothetical protein n=1 Tax=Pseudomonas sp. PS1(2021) TaxID=2866282 RepID=UPI001CF07521|nr:hypothetical protein [Pseudomonas sp. PS1(2021)]UCM29405.1 hypothetical protein LE197_05695 [Pseudomonas sp. PS1(2021)]
MTDAITIHNPRNRGGSTGHVLAKRSVTFTEIRIDDGRTEWLVLPGQPPCESPAAALSLAEAALYRVRGFDARGRPLFSD